MFREFQYCVIVLFFCSVISTIDTLEQNPVQCGMSKIRKAKLILHGRDTFPGKWPWHVAIYHRENRAYNYACGGTLISEKFVLTAAHCVLDSSNGQQLVNSRIFVRLGVYDLNALEIGSFQQHRIHKIHIHPDYEGGNELRDDIAILELATEARFNNYVQPACLSMAEDLSGKYGTAIGWGFTENDESSNTLKTVRMPVVDAMTCLKSDRELFGQTLDKGLFCAGYTNGTGMCNGDSGGGMFFKLENAWYLGGIVSFTKSRDINSNLCHSNSYGAFTRVYTYLSWISTVTKLKTEEVAAEDQQGPDVCKAKYVDPSKTYPPQLLPRDCGVYINNRIARGIKTEVFELPWMAIINNGQGFCHGSLINKRYVLSSAGCMEGHDERTYVTLGEHTRDQAEDCNIIDGEKECAPPARDYGIECVINHQSYSNETEVNDIALIRLDRDVQFETHIQPICLPVTKSLRKFYPQKYIMAGWGFTAPKQNNPTSVLMKAIVTLADRDECTNWVEEYDMVLDQSHICVGQRGFPSMCKGDAGGPLGYTAWYNGMRFIQFGVASNYGERCNSFSKYTNVAYHMDWIIANIEP